MSLRLLIVPLLLGLAACTGNNLNYDTWVSENAPASASDASFKAAVGVTCIRGGDKSDGEVVNTSGGTVHHYAYACNPPPGQSQSGGPFDFLGL